MQFIKRQIARSIEAMMNKYPIIAVTGPRQSGKTTLLRSMFPEYRYVSMEDEPTRVFATEDPVGFLKRYDSKVIFDEAQKTPRLFSYLQGIVDNSGVMGQFVLSGSQNFQLMHNITQSLAGRVCIFKLLPFDFQELSSHNLLSDDWRELVYKGFYPALYDRDIEPPVFYSNYIQTYVERDVTELLRIQETRQFRNFLGLCAARTGQMINLNNLSVECGITQPTAKSWLSILESSFLIFLVQPYFENFSKRIVKTPKLYFYDTGMASFLLGVREKDDLNNPTILGSLFENMMVAEMFKQNQHRYLLKDYWFWRDSNGNEVDLLTKKGLLFDTFEIKSSQTLLPGMFKGLDYFYNLAPDQMNNRTIIYGGDEDQERSKYRVRSWKSIL
jgi:hypothetical protein